MDPNYNKTNLTYEKINNMSITKLEELITLAFDKYFNTETPIMSDETYDTLVDFLKLKAPKSKVLKNIGAKPVKNKVKLDYWMGSIDKIKLGYDKELDKWMKKYKPPYYVSDKLDGVSALLIYRPDSTINLYTRGTATEGQDISHLIKYFDLPKITKPMAFRGEIIITKKKFNENWSKSLKNARNAISGLVNSKNINPKLANDTDLVIYEIVNQDMNYENQMKTIKKLGLKCVDYSITDKLDFDILSKYLKTRRVSSDYTIDGIIVIDNNINQRNIKGNPEYAFAYKDIIEEQIMKTKVLKIEWNVSKDGYIKPILIVEPVTIGGVEISRVTGHNAKYIVDNKLGTGSEIELIRSGEVIPYIHKVIKSIKNPELPTDILWHWNKTKVDIIADDLESKDVLIKNIYFFFSKLETKGLGEKIVEKMVNANLNSIEKILKAKESDFLKVEGIKTKSANNLMNAIKKATSDVKLHILMAASNKLGHGIGSERIKHILDVYPNLLVESNKWSTNEFIDNLKELSGWEEKTSKLFVSNFSEFKKFYNNIKTLITITSEETKKIISSKYLNKIIVLSGFRDSELQKKLEDLGAKITNSISKNTDLLVVKDDETLNNATGKVKKALELGIKIITKETLLK